MERVIVVGAGIAGLSAAYYARKAGFDVLVLERCHNPGGVSVSWKRKGYTIEGGMHWLVGSSPMMGGHYSKWVELGALTDNNPVVYHDPVCTYRNGDVTLRLWRDTERLRKELIEFAPEDSKAINSFISDVRLAIDGFSSWPSDLAGRFRRFFRMLPFGLAALRFLWYSIEHYNRRFRNAEVRNFLNSFVNCRQNLMSMMYTMATFCMGDSGFPEGGSARMTSNMADKIVSMGVEIKYGVSVQKVCVRQGRVEGVLVDGEQIPSGRVIVACDTRYAIDNLFDEPLNELWARRMRRHVESMTSVFAAFGVEADLSAYPFGMRLQLTPALDKGGVCTSNIQVYKHDGDYAPVGCSVLTVPISADTSTYEWWKRVKSEGRYKECKSFVLDEIEARLCEAMPEVEGKVVMRDMATPLTFERYCNSHSGGWMRMWREKTIPAFLPSKSRTVKGLYFGSFRSMLSGGLPVAMLAGRRAAQNLGRPLS